MTEPRGTAPASAAGAEPTATEPTQAEIDEWAARERQRREAWLKAAEGAVALAFKLSRRTFAELIRAGREWEEETSLPIRRRRVSMDDEGS